MLKDIGPADPKWDEMRPGTKPAGPTGTSHSPQTPRRAANTHLEALPLLPGTQRPVVREAEPTLEDAAIELTGFASSALSLHGVV